MCVQARCGPTFHIPKALQEIKVGDGASTGQSKHSVLARFRPLRRADLKALLYTKASPHPLRRQLRNPAMTHLTHHSMAMPSRLQAHRCGRATVTASATVAPSASETDSIESEGGLHRSLQSEFPTAGPFDNSRRPVADAAFLGAAQLRVGAGCCSAATSDGSLGERCPYDEHHLPYDASPELENFDDLE
jgi:hypothetical protein